MNKPLVSGVGAVFTAIAASLCCITPLLAVVAGTGGIASTFTWLEPLRPFLIGMTLLVLGFAWFQKFKSRKTLVADCACEPEKPHFFQSKIFLSIATVVSILMLGFPYYSQMISPNRIATVTSVENTTGKSVELTITGMDCQPCAKGIEASLASINGVYQATVNYSENRAILRYNPQLVSSTEFIEQIKQSGYTAVVEK